jgi:NADH dehydrogenase
MEKSIVIAGCGFGGLEMAYHLHRMLGNSVKITAIDRNDKFTYYPSLPELAAGKIKESDITIPYDILFKRIKADFLKAEIQEVDWKNKKLQTSGGQVQYDYLVLSLGSQSAYYDIPGAKENTFEFKSVSDAAGIRDQITRLFSSCTADSMDESATTVVVIGGGLTGVELVTDLKDMLDRVCRDRKLPRDKCRLILVGRGPRLHPTFNEEVGAFTEKYLNEKGITLVLGTAAAEIRKGEVLLEGGKTIKAGTIIWCAGIKPSEVSEKFGEPSFNKRCGLVLNSYLEFIGDPSIFAIGDCAYCKSFEVSPILTAVRAIEQAEFASNNLYCEMTGKKDRRIVYDPRRFPALISLCHGMGILTFDGFWMKGRLMAWVKKMVEYLFVWRYRYNLWFLEYVDEFFTSMILFFYFMKMRRP